MCIRDSIKVGWQSRDPLQLAEQGRDPLACQRHANFGDSLPKTKPLDFDPIHHISSFKFPFALASIATLKVYRHKEKLSILGAGNFYFAPSLHPAYQILYNEDIK